MYSGPPNTSEMCPHKRGTVALSVTVSWIITLNMLKDRFCCIMSRPLARGAFIEGDHCITKGANIMDANFSVFTVSG